MSQSKEEEVRSNASLKRVLELPASILLVAGIMIGSGVFKKMTPIARTGLDSAQILLGWVVAGLITLCGAFTYSGLASLTRTSGGVYEYLRILYGDFVAYLFGWTLFMIGGSGAIAALAYVFSQSVAALVGLPEPLAAFRQVEWWGGVHPFADSGIKALAVATIGMLTWINFRGVSKGSRLNSVVTWAKLLGMGLLILAGFWHGPVADFSKTAAIAAPEGKAWLGAFFGALLSILWAYDGWANLTYVTGEIKNPEKNVPLAITFGLGIAMFLYLLLNGAFLRVLPLRQFAGLGDDQIAGAVVAEACMGPVGRSLIAGLIMISTFGALSGCVMVYPRVYFRMAQQHSFFRSAASVHPRYRTPYNALWFSLAWSVWLVCTGTFDLLTNLIVFSGYLFFGLLAWGAIRFKRSGRIRTRIIGYPVVPLLVILFSLALVINTLLYQTRSAMLGLVMVGSGIPFYYFFRKNRRKAPAVQDEG